MANSGTTRDPFDFLETCLSWVVGGILLLVGLGTFAKSVPWALLLVALSAVFLPVTRFAAHRLTGLAIPIKHRSIWLIIGLVIIGVGAEYFKEEKTSPVAAAPPSPPAAARPAPAPAPPPKPRREPTRAERLTLQFSAWDGSHYGLEAFIQRNMHDPDSYEHVQTTYRDMGDHLIVTTRYRGKNRLGAKVLESMTAKVTLDGVVIDIVR